MVGGDRVGFRTVAFDGDSVDGVPVPDADFAVDDIRDLLAIAGVDSA